MDLGKAVALMANHDGKLLDYAVNEGGYGKINETMPMIAIPTTSGTGSEVSVGSLIIMNDGRKLIFASPHLMPNAGELSSNEWGYGYQWWVPGNPITDYTAHGIFNQFIYVEPVTNVVIAKTSSNHRFRSEREYSKAAHIAIFRAITKNIENEYKE